MNMTQRCYDYGIARIWSSHDARYNNQHDITKNFMGTTNGLRHKASVNKSIANNIEVVDF